MELLIKDLSQTPNDERVNIRWEWYTFGTTTYNHSRIKILLRLKDRTPVLTKNRQKKERESFLCPVYLRRSQLTDEKGIQSLLKQLRKRDSSVQKQSLWSCGNHIKFWQWRCPPPKETTSGISDRTSRTSILRIFTPLRRFNPEDPEKNWGFDHV